MEELGPLLLSNALLAAALMLAIWAVSLFLRDVSIVDVFWGPGFVVLAWSSYLQGAGYEPRALLIAGLVTLWGLRLGTYLGARWLGHEHEDPRYAAMRSRRGPAFAWQSLYIVFGLQAAILWFVALPIQVGAVQTEPAHLTVWDAVGAAVFAVGFCFEAVGDAQLTAFKADPTNAGKVMDRGLWAWTRHPNYFGDALVWWGIFLIAASTPAGWWTILSPVLMTYLLVAVSGKPMLERGLRKSRPEYAAYVERVSAFVPLPPKRQRHDSVDR